MKNVFTIGTNQSPELRFPNKSQNTHMQSNEQIFRVSKQRRKKYQAKSKNWACLKQRGTERWEVRCQNNESLQNPTLFSESCLEYSPLPSLSLHATPQIFINSFIFFNKKEIKKKMWHRWARTCRVDNNVRGAVGDEGCGCFDLVHSYPECTAPAAAVFDNSSEFFLIQPTLVGRYYKIW